ncbi:SpoIID/LytB domain protein [Anaerobranca californiensis DSM 14826]|jgi:peptidoglycan hydrolase-like amidase|uniref:SpoIID/LytB domain protein n=1 Tax=Anaerobranca californiensis DSM 14826 TaxID=1120989 RepID=A0A1M6NA39_9FIRM|nr:SpoIID/LytB domain-containing protein [Anaerobranca californiensis]SHJ92524.1 SpoIID/LytB domain protein [Anaerobranca californiensis DSM 14826]
MKGKLKFLSLFLSILILTNFLQPLFSVYANNNYSIIRVLISINKNTIPITLNGDYSISEDPSITLSNGNYFISVTSNNQVRILGSGVDKVVGSSLTLVRHSADSTLTVRGTDHGDVTYLGNMKFTVNSQTGMLRVVNHVPLEQYLYGVVAYEMSNSFPLEALKAQAVAARGYAIKKIMAAGSSSDFDILDTPQHQVYRGYNPAFARVIKAVDETKGQVLTYDNKIIETFYSASNGGQTELPGNAWGRGSDANQELPYLVQKDDPYDLENPSSIFHRFYIPKEVIGSDHDSIPMDSDNGLRIVKTNGNINVRSGPGTNHSIIGRAPLYTSYQHLETVVNQFGETWHKIIFNGNEAYISGAFSHVSPGGKHFYANPVLWDLQQQAFEILKDNVEKATDIKIISVNNLKNGNKRWPDTESRSHVTADANITVEYEILDENEEKILKEEVLDVSIQLMIPSGSEYINNHPYLSSNTRMRWIESKGEDGFELLAGRFGHGVGMSQRGAQQMAAAHNKTYAEILAFYFEGTKLSTFNTDIPPLPPKPGDDSATIDPSYELTKILSFKINNQVGETMIDDENSKITLTMPSDTDLTRLIANFQLAEGAYVKVNDKQQKSGETVNDFSKPVVYKVYGVDGSIREWTVIVKLDVIPVKGVEIKKIDKMVPIGSTKNLEYVITPENATNKEVIWSSSDDKIIKVDKTGKISPLAVGTATITATTVDGNFKDSITVNVYKYGDVNGDGVVNVSDAIIILKYIVGDHPKSDLLYAAGDVNGDGRIDVSDAILILQRTVGSIDKFPVE